MSVFKKRKRMVSFRVSDEEFELLQHISRTHGAHSMSDYARIMACRAIVEQSGDSGLATQVQTLYDRVEGLNQEMRRIAALVKERP